MVIMTVSKALSPAHSNNLISKMKNKTFFYKNVSSLQSNINNNMVSVSTEAYNPVQGYMFLVSIKAQIKWNVGQE